MSAIYKITPRADTLENWLKVDPVLFIREVVYVSTTNSNEFDALKIGDGLHKFSELPLKGLSSRNTLDLDQFSESFPISQKLASEQINALATVAKTGKYSDLVDEPIAQSSQAPTGNEPLWVNPDEDQEEVEVYNRSQVDALLDTKQDIIPDLDTIREGAGKGSTALQKESDPVYLADKPSLLLEINGKANLQHQHTVADITNFPELYYDATAFFTSGAYPSDRYEELLEAVKAKKTVYATIDEEGYVSYVFFMSSTNSDGSSSRVLLTTIFADGDYLYINTFVLQQSGMTTLQEGITGKANKATTLAGYGIMDAYTKTKTDELLNAKQNELTLTVKDNGNIVIGNIQGQTKEFMPATPSGDPMHYAYEAAGAEWNGTGADITKTTPWADLADDDTDKTVVHKAGYWYLNGLGDITNEQMRRIYMITASNQNYWDNYCNGQDLRTNILTVNEKKDVATNLVTVKASFRRSTIEVIRIPTNDEPYTNNIYAIPLFTLSFIPKLKFVIGIFHSPIKAFSTSYITDLKGIKIAYLSVSIGFLQASNLSVKSVLYMIQHEKATSAITITLHADAYARAMANADILAALEAHPNISIASA